ncbi:MAG: murein biosynthesis integral membrane protein MurJ [Eubacteriales bacterium]
MKKTALALMIITILSKLFGFFREIVLAYYYGASNISDVYLISDTIPNVIFGFIGAGIATTYIPVYTSALENDGRLRSDSFTSNFLNLIFFISTLVVGLVIIFAPYVVLAFASGFSDEVLKLAVEFVRISVFAVYFNGCIHIFKSYLEVNGSFKVPASKGFISNIFVISFIALSSKYGIKLLPYGILLGMVSQALFLIPFAFKKGYRHKFVIDIKDKYLRKMIFLALPVILGTSVNKINTLVDRTLASRIAVGGISALNYANRLEGFITGIFVVSITTVMYPTLSKKYAENNIVDFKGYIIKSISAVNLFVVPAAVGALIFAEPIVKLLFNRGAFDEEAVILTSGALFYYSIGLVSIGLRDVLSRGFFAMQDTKTPVKNSALGVILNIILNIILSRYMGLKGLALATSISATFTMILMFITLRRKLGMFGLKKAFNAFLKIAAASVVMAVISKSVFRFLLNYYSSNRSLFWAVVVGVFLYFILIYVFKIEEINEFVKDFKEKYIKKSRD